MPRPTIAQPERTRSAAANQLVSTGEVPVAQPTQPHSEPFTGTPNGSAEQRQLLTVIIPCKDEQANLRRCIEAARAVADEIVVADSGSQDGSRELAAELGCRVIEREYVHSGDFKNWAIPQAQHAWVLIVDADERVTPELAAEIRSTLENPQRTGYWIYRANYFMGHRVRFGGWRSDRVLRLFRRDSGRYVGQTDHAEVELSDGPTGRLRHRLVHFTYTDYDQYFRKFQRYTRQRAELWYAAGRRPSLWRLALSGPLRFVRSYFLQLGILDGRVGLQVAALTGFYSFMKQARLWELHHAVDRRGERVDDHD